MNAFENKNHKYIAMKRDEEEPMRAKQEVNKRTLFTIIVADIYIAHTTNQMVLPPKLTVNKKENKHRISLVPYSMYLSVII